MTRNSRDAGFIGDGGDAGDGDPRGGGGAEGGAALFPALRLQLRHCAAPGVAEAAPQELR